MTLDLGWGKDSTRNIMSIRNHRNGERETDKNKQSQCKQGMFFGCPRPLSLSEAKWQDCSITATFSIRWAKDRLKMSRCQLSGTKDLRISGSSIETLPSCWPLTWWDLQLVKWRLTEDKNSLCGRGRISQESVLFSWAFSKRSLPSVCPRPRVVFKCR